MPDSKICDECDGRGWLPNPDMDTSDPNSPDHFDCKKCDGDGFVYT